MRILIPNHCSPDTFVENVAHTLRAMGHDVRTMTELPVEEAFSRSRHAFRRVVAELPGYRPPEERWLLRTIGDFRPEMVLALTQQLSEETLREARRLGVRSRVAWWGDTPANMTRMGLLSEGWDFLFLKDPDAVAKFRCLGLPVHLLHEAMNPAWHRPLANTSNDEVVVAGSAYGYRQFMVRKLVHNRVKVALYGSVLPPWSLPEVRRAYRGRYIVREEKSLIFGEGLACLNGSPPTEGNSLNCRAFEIAGAGGLQVFDFRPLVTECFEPGKEILVFRSFEELLEILQRAAHAPGEMKQIREAGAKRALAEHTYRHRLERILKLVA